MSKNLTFRLEDDLDQEALDVIARLERRSVSDVLREAVAEYVKTKTSQEELAARLDQDLQVLRRIEERNGTD